jgi:PKD repeat protein
MKKITLIITVSFAMISSCKKDYGQRGDACISADKITVVTNEQINISNCGDELPSSRVATSLDWGDGIKTNGQTGTHAYTTSGTYNIRLLLNGDYAADVAEVDENKVKIQITVN